MVVDDSARKGKNNNGKGKSQCKKEGT